MLLHDILTWLIVGALAGALTGLTVNRAGGRFANLMIGLVGAVVGGHLTGKFHINLGFGLGNVTISFKDIISATFGALLFILFLFLIKQIWNYIFKKIDESLEE